MEQSTSSASLGCVPKEVTQGGFMGMWPCSRLVPGCFSEAVFSLVLLGAVHPHPAPTISSKLKGAAYGVGPCRSPDVGQSRFTVKFQRQPQAGWWDLPLIHTMQRSCVLYVGLDSAAFQRPLLSARACPSTQHSSKPPLKTQCSKKDSSGTHRPTHPCTGMDHTRHIHVTMLRTHTHRVTHPHRHIHAHMQSIDNHTHIHTQIYSHAYTYM